MPAIFPKTNPDGSFCVIANLTVDVRPEPELRTSVQAWLHQWVLQHATRMQETTTAGMVTTQELRYDTQFAGDPQVVECDESGISIRFVGQPLAREWKNWFVWIIRDLIAARIGVTSLKGCKDC